MYCIYCGQQIADANIQLQIARFVKRVILAFVLLLLPLVASADRVIERNYSKNGMSARIVFTLPVDAGVGFDESTETTDDDDTAPQYTRYRASSATLHNGDTFKVECFVTGDDQKNRVSDVRLSAYNSYNTGLGWSVDKTITKPREEDGTKVYRAEWTMSGLYTPDEACDAYGIPDLDFYYRMSGQVTFRVDNAQGQGRFVQFAFYIDRGTVVETIQDNPVVEELPEEVYDEDTDTDYYDDEEEEAADDETHVVIDSDADGNDSGWIDWVIPVSIIGVLLLVSIGFAVRRPKKNDDEGDDEEDEDHYTYALRISKRLGDTVIVGDPPAGVYAYVVRIDKYGSEVTDERLTRMIRITGDDFLLVSGQTYQQGTMSANVEAPKDYDGPLPEEGIVSFTVASAEASFTNRMHFKIDAPSIDFAQDELTLPDHMAEVLYLPFEVSLLGQHPSVVIAMSGDTYTAELEHDAEGDIYYAVIREKPLPPGAPIPNEVPGTHTQHILTVQASGDGRSVEVQFPIKRFVMGLACENLFEVKCYLEEYNPHAGHKIDLRRRVMVDSENTLHGDPRYVSREMAPAINKFNLSLYEYDVESRRIICIPPTITDYDIVIDDPVPAGRSAADMMQQASILMGGLAPGGISAAMSQSAAQINAQNEAYQQKMERIQALGFHLDAKSGFDSPACGGQSLLCQLYCRSGILSAPHRWNARIYIEAEYNGRRYVIEQPVILLSQPRRTYNSPGDVDAKFQSDEVIRDALERMRTDIYVHHYADLSLLHMFVDQMLDYYNSDYGFDWQQVRAVFRTFNSYLHHESLINQYAAEDETLCFVDGLARTLALGHSAEQNLGFFQRLTLGIITLGISEGVFNTLEVVRNMKNYVDAGGNSVFVGWCYGAVVPIREYLLGKAFEYGLASLKSFIANRRLLKFGRGNGAVTPTPAAGKTAGKTAGTVGKEVTREAAEEAAQRAAKEAAEMSNHGIRTTNMEKVAKTISERSRTAKGEAKRLVGDTKLAGGLDGELLDAQSKALLEAERTGLEKGAKKVDKYRRLAELPDTMANRQKRLDALMEVQSDKHAMSLLNDTDNQTLNALRKQFNGDMKKVHFSAEFDMKAALVEQLDRDPRFKGRRFDVDDIHGFNATKATEDALAHGDKVPMDYDGTFYVIDEVTNQRIYLSQEQVEGAFQQFLYKKATGKQGNPQIWAEYMGITDHTIIQSDLHIESYGQKNIDIMLDNSRAWESLPDAQRVAKAATDKCMHWYNEGMRLISLGGESNTEKGVAMIRESLRQCKKQFDNFAVVRDAARELTNGGSKISNHTYAMMQYIGETDIFKGSLRVGECLKGLERMGTSAPEIFRELGNLFLQIG